MIRTLDELAAWRLQRLAEVERSRAGADEFDAQLLDVAAGKVEQVRLAELEGDLIKGLAIAISTEQTFALIAQTNKKARAGRRFTNPKTASKSTRGKGEKAGKRKSHLEAWCKRGGNLIFTDTGRINALKTARAYIDKFGLGSQAERRIRRQIAEIFRH